MTEAQKILQMIESVDVEDTTTLREINARADWWIGGHKSYPDCEYVKAIKDYKEDCPSYGYIVLMKPEGETMRRIPCYRRNLVKSRDALKSIRPDGWLFNIKSYEIGFSQGGYTCYCERDEGHLTAFISPEKNRLPTEELAELHAIIQAIEWERQNE